MKIILRKSTEADIIKKRLANLANSFGKFIDTDTMLSGTKVRLPINTPSPCTKIAFRRR